MTTILQQDLKEVYNKICENDKKAYEGKNVLVTGFAGSLGYTLMAFFKEYGKKIGIKKVYGIDNYIFGKPSWIKEFENDDMFTLLDDDITTCDLKMVFDSNIIFHMASLASPVYYRLYPIETIDADVLGLRRLLDFFKDKNLYNLLFFSTSEIYGDPAFDKVPTSEDYWGNVNTSGPRACYDESKRFGETLCYNFNKVYSMPITVIRPFNSFGPGLRTNDKRVVADFAMNVLNNEDIVIYSDGKATRTFCYAVDTLVGILKCAVYKEYDIFNIGSNIQEINIDELAEIYKKIAQELNGYNGNVVYKTHEDKHYLTDNPQRRCPNINKAKEKLNYNPTYTTEEGVRRYLKHIIEEGEM